VTGIATAGTGGLDNTGTATITRSEVSGSSGRLGGGILNDPIGTLTLTNSTVSGNSASVAGGGIWNGGVVTITSSTVSGNTSSGSGGGIHNQNQLIVTSSTISQNTSSGVGGGIYTGRFLGMTSSTVSGNSAGSNGGGIFNDFGEVIAATSTVSGNSATSVGGGIFTRNALTIVSSTVSANSASSGAGIFQDTFGSSRIISSIDAGNSAGDCSGPGAFASDGYNLVGSDCGFSSTGDQTVADSASAIGIKPLGNHGGRTQTMPLAPKSPAVDAIPVGASAGDGTVLCPYSDDQRGLARPQGVACDVGAYELRNTTPPPDSADLVLTKTDGVGSVAAGTSTTYTITVTNNGPLSVPAGVVVSDPIPAGTTGLESEVDCTFAAGTLFCTTSAALAPSAAISYQLTLTVPTGYPRSSLANTASITSSPLPDPEASNDSATDTDSVTTSAGP
jgi:uncharacterized repeat protein (TIGR01451 family)